MEMLGTGKTKRERGSMTQPVTSTDIANGRIRLPHDAKRLFPASRGEVDEVLRGRRLRASYDPRRGPDKQRSAVLKVRRETLSRVVRPQERLGVQVGGDGLVHLD